MSNEAESRFVSVGGLRLHYFDWGKARAPALVLLHDLAESADVWRPVAGALGERFHVLAVDMRGHGDSDWIDTYSPQEQGDDIGELIESLGLAPAAVMGTGMGGRAAALLAARQEHHLSHVVVVEAGVRMYLPAEREAEEAILTMPRVYDSARDYLEQWTELRVTLGLRNAGPSSADSPALVAAERLLRRLSIRPEDSARGISGGGTGFAPKCDLDGYQRYRARSPGTRTISYHDEFHEITTPALLVHGADSPLLSHEEARDTARTIPGCRLVEVPGARHDLLADNPEGLLEAVLPFLIEA